jgi:galactose mutarotase-like enzyme
MIARLTGGNGLDLAVDVDSGARIISLTTADGSEWLAPSHPTSQPSEAPSFKHAGMGGWDEVAPTVQPDTLPDGTVLRDHGDIWNVPWTELESAAGSLKLGVEIASIRTTLSRTITATSTGLRMSYRAATTSMRPVPFLWAAHPQFSATPASTLLLALRDVEVLPQLVEHYPVAGAVRRFDHRLFDEWAPSGCSLKTFVAAGQAVDSATLTGPGEFSLRLSWDPMQLPYLGLFWDNREFAPNRVFAVEPSTGFGDVTSAALENNQVSLLPRERPLEWWVDLASERAQR